MLENREMATAKDVFPMIANIWLLRRLDHICPLNPAMEGHKVSKHKIRWGWGDDLAALRKDTLHFKVYEPLPEKRKLGVESNAKVQRNWK